MRRYGHNAALNVNLAADEKKVDLYLALIDVLVKLWLLDLTNFSRF